MDGQTKTLIQLDASQLIYLWRLAWLCQIAAYVRQQSTEPATPEPKPLQGKKSPEQSCTKGKPLATGCCIKGKVPSVRRCTSSVPIFANGAVSAAFTHLFNAEKEVVRRFVEPTAGTYRGEKIPTSDWKHVDIDAITASGIELPWWAKRINILLTVLDPSVKSREYFHNSYLDKEYREYKQWGYEKNGKWIPVTEAFDINIIPDSNYSELIYRRRGEEFQGCVVAGIFCKESR